MDEEKRMKQGMSAVTDLPSNQQKERKKNAQKNKGSIYLFLGLPLSALVVAGSAGRVHLQFDALFRFLPHRQGHVDGTGHRCLLLHGCLTCRSIFLDAQLNEKEHTRKWSY